MTNPYRSRGYTAKLHEGQTGDYLQIYRHGKYLAEIAVTVMPTGPNAEASITVKRFNLPERQTVNVTDRSD